MDVNDAYEAYRSNPTDENYAQLYNVAREYALKIGNGLLRALGSTHQHACENAATTVLLSFSEKFDPQKASFSTWAYQSIRADLLDWRRKKDRLYQKETAYLEYMAALAQKPMAADDKLLLEEILLDFSEDDVRLLRWKVNGESIESMARQLGVSIATIKRRWDDLLTRAHNAGVT
ncbi:MAG: sigma-70 family RNA polymerase sigma factor [Ktedonobacteraceae bacterium]